MADNRTGLSAADLAEQFRDMCGDGSMEWVAGPMQTWLLLDAADMLDENAKLLDQKIDAYNEMVNARLDADQLQAENAKLRELVRIAIEYCDSGTCDGCPIQRESGSCPYSDMARELGVEVD